MSFAIYNLKHEHRIIERALRALEGICLRLEAGDAVPLDALMQAVEFIGTFADSYHHGKEEEFLFPALERAGIERAGGALGAIDHQHELERELTSGLNRAIRACQLGNEGAQELFVTDARRYVDLMIRHMQMEDSMLFRLADEVLSEEEHDQLQQAFRQAQSELGMAGVERYERLAAELEQQWSV